MAFSSVERDKGINKENSKPVFIFFAFACLIYFFLGHFNKSIFIIYDELYYLEAARSIAHGSGMIYNGIISPFQKVFYSLVISPAFLVNDQRLQMTLISLINAICTASAVFPAYFLSKEAGLIKQKSYVFCIFTLIFPETLNTMSFMSEVAFYPMWLWVLYFVYRHVTKDRVGTWESVLLGGLAYFLYMTKEVGIIALPAFVGIEFLYFIFKRSSIRRLVQCGISFFSFVVFYALCKMLFFSQTAGGSYPVWFPEGLYSVIGVLFFGYIVIYYLVYIILSLFVFPVFFMPPKNSRDRQFFIYVSGCIITLVLVIAFTISMREDYLQASPRLHLRYLAPLTIPYILFFLKYSKSELYKIHTGKEINVIFLYVYMALILLIPVVNTHGLMDSKGIEVFRIIGIATERLLGERIGLILYYIGLKMTCMIFIIIGISLLKKKTNHFQRYFIVSVAVICVLSSLIKIYEIRSLYKEDLDSINQAIAFNDRIDELEGEKLIVLRESTDRNARIVLTYHDNGSDFSYDNDIMHEKVHLLAGGRYRDVMISEYDYLCFDKSIVNDNKAFIDSLCGDIIWESGIFEIRQVKK